MRVDKATEMREKLQYARVLLEVKVDHEFPDQISFVNEKGIDVVFEIHYEWKPVMCDVCHQLGHSKEECKKVRVQQRWQPKAQVPNVNVAEPEK